MHFSSLVSALSIPALVLPAAIALAGPPPGREPPRPPQEAFDACKGLSAGTACTVNFHDRELQGTCDDFGDLGLACRPDDMPPPPPR